MIMGILGGIMIPKKPALATVASEKGSGYPFRVSSGIKIAPMAEHVAAAEPQIAPKKAEATKVTIASPPGNHPTSE